MTNEHRSGRDTLKHGVTRGVRDAIHADDAECADPQSPLFGVDEADGGPMRDLPVDGISVRVDPTDRTTWLVTVKIPRHSLTDGEAEILRRLED